MAGSNGVSFDNGEQGKQKVQGMKKKKPDVASWTCLMER